MGMGNRNDAVNIHQGVSVKVLLGQGWTHARCVSFLIQGFNIIIILRMVLFHSRTSAFVRRRRRHNEEFGRGFNEAHLPWMSPNRGPDNTSKSYKPRFLGDDEDTRHEQ